MKCKVKIGCNYEPKWFERRMTSGWYSGKNPRLDNYGMALQSCLLGTGVARYWKTQVFGSLGMSAFCLYAAWCYGWFA
jgi:hypothetical protein